MGAVPCSREVVASKLSQLTSIPSFDNICTSSEFDMPALYQKRSFIATTE